MFYFISNSQSHIACRNFISIPNSLTWIFWLIVTTPTAANQNNRKKRNITSSIPQYNAMDGMVSSSWPESFDWLIKQRAHLLTCSYTEWNCYVGVGWLPAQIVQCSRFSGFVCILKKLKKLRSGFPSNISMSSRLEAVINAIVKPKMNHLGFKTVFKTSWNQIGLSGPKYCCLGYFSVENSWQ